VFIVVGFWFSLRFLLDPLDLFLLGKKRFCTRALRSTLGACDVLVNTLRSFGGMRCWVNTSRSFGGVQLLVLASFLVLVGVFSHVLFLFL
jgi:hypothetical protein